MRREKDIRHACVPASRERKMKMDNNILFQGIYSAAFSIYNESMDVKKDSVEKLVRYNLKNGVDGFYVGGNTGEGTVVRRECQRAYEILHNFSLCHRSDVIAEHLFETVQ
nr:dihydrodipicolinate synthase family protein [uncultured Acetatifactor sp.]